MKTYIFDLDGPRTAHMIVGFAEAEERNGRILVDNGVVQVIRNILDDLQAERHVVLMTARPERMRAIMSQWLHRWGVRYDFLAMRAESDIRPIYQFKEEVVRRHVESGYKVLGVFEDNPATAKDFEERLGVPVVSVRDGASGWRDEEDTE